MFSPSISGSLFPPFFSLYPIVLRRGLRERCTCPPQTAVILLWTPVSLLSCPTTFWIFATQPLNLPFGYHSLPSPLPPRLASLPWRFRLPGPPSSSMTSGFEDSGETLPGCPLHRALSPPAVIRRFVLPTDGSRPTRRPERARGCKVPASRLTPLAGTRCPMIAALIPPLGFSLSQFAWRPQPWFLSPPPRFPYFSARARVPPNCLHLLFGRTVPVAFLIVRLISPFFFFAP